MAITFRNIKGAPLTHDELDENFRSYFHSASVEGSALLLYRPYAVTSSISFPIPSSELFCSRDLKSS